MVVAIEAILSHGNVDAGKFTLPGDLTTVEMLHIGTSHQEVQGQLMMLGFDPVNPRTGYGYCFFPLEEVPLNCPDLEQGDIICLVNGREHEATLKCGIPKNGTHAGIKTPLDVPAFIGEFVQGRAQGPSRWCKTSKPETNGKKQARYDNKTPDRFHLANLLLSLRQHRGIKHMIIPFQIFPRCDGPAPWLVPDFEVKLWGQDQWEDDSLRIESSEF